MNARSKPTKDWTTADKLIFAGVILVLIPLFGLRLGHHGLIRHSSGRFASSDGLSLLIPGAISFSIGVLLKWFRRA